MNSGFVHSGMPQAVKSKNRMKIFGPKLGKQEGFWYFFFEFEPSIFLGLLSKSVGYAYSDMLQNAWNTVADQENHISTVSKLYARSLFQVG
jgi:hypothetical protein